MIDVGLEGLFRLRLSEPDIRMFSWLVENFNHASRRLHFSDRKAFLVTVDDVYDVLCIPRNEGNAVVDAKAHSSDRTVIELWKCGHGVASDVIGKVELKLNKMLERAIDHVDGGEDFKRLFVMYALSSCLA